MKYIKNVEAWLFDCECNLDSAIEWFLRSSLPRTGFKGIAMSENNAYVEIYPCNDDDDILTVDTGDLIVFENERFFVVNRADVKKRGYAPSNQKDKQ